MKRFAALFFAAICAGFPAGAFAIDLTAAFRHSPQRVTAGEGMETRYRLEIASTGITRARVLASGMAGYRAVRMTLVGTSYVAEIPVGGGAAALAYQFQVETNVGQVLLSAPYSFTLSDSAAPGGDDPDLPNKLALAKARISQLQSAIHTLNTADPQQLGKNRLRDTARVGDLLALKEADLARAREELKRALEGLQQSVGNWTPSPAATGEGAK